MNLSAHNRLQKGFSLIEVLIAVFITGALVLVIANIPQAIKLVTGSQSELKVKEVAAKKIEDLRLSGYDNLANGATSISDSKLNGLANVSGNALISDCTSPLCPNGELAKQVTINVTWTENTEPKRFSISTLIAKGGLRCPTAAVGVW